MDTFNKILIWVNTICIPLLVYKGIKDDDIFMTVLNLFYLIFVGYVVYQGSKTIYK